MRLSQGSRSSFCSAGPVSLAPRPRPPYFVVVGSDVFKYESYWNGQFWAQTFGSVVSSVTSTIRTKGCRASCLRSKMFVRSGSRITVRPAIPSNPSKPRSQPRLMRSPLRIASALGAVPGPGVTVQAIQRSPPVPTGLHDCVDQGFVTPQAIRADEVTVLRRDLDRLLEVLQRKGGRVAKAVLGLRHPLHDARVRQMTLDAGRGVAMATLEPRVVLLVHDVAIHARARIRRKIGEALRVDEGERADADRNPQQADKPDDKPRSRHESSLRRRSPLVSILFRRLRCHTSASRVRREFLTHRRESPIFGSPLDRRSFE